MARKHDPEQRGHLDRVAGKIGDAIMSFARERMAARDEYFTMEQLTAHIAEYHGIAPDSPGRVLRSLRQAKQLDYKVVNRAQSLYQLTAVAEAG